MLFAEMVDDLCLRATTYLALSDLVRLACAWPRFAREGMSERAARLIVQQRKDRERAPRGGGESWLVILQELERLAKPLSFTRSGRNFRIRGTEAMGGYGWALCDRVPMRGGKHYAEFTILPSENVRIPSVGITRPEYDGARRWGPLTPVEQRLPPVANVTVQNAPLRTQLRLQDGTSTRSHEYPTRVTISKGDVVGLLIDFTDQSREAPRLTLFKNKSLVKSIVLPAALGGGSWCWMAFFNPSPSHDLHGGVRIVSNAPMPMPGVDPQDPETYDNTRKRPRVL